MKGKIAYCTVPESGGLFAFYKNLRQALAPHGWELLATCTGVSSKRRWDDTFADSSCHLIAPDETELQRSSEAFAEWVEKNDIDIVIPMDDSIATSALPHLKPEVKVVTRCSTVSDFGFRICLLCPERLSRIVVMTPAQQERLLKYPGAKGKIELIPHGVDLDQIVGVRNLTEGNEGQGVFRIIYIGRLEDRSKGVLFLPAIIARLAEKGIDVELDVIGDGPDRQSLEKRFEELQVGDKVKLCGSLPRPKLIERLNSVEYDALLMPSRYEGFPNALLEAMAAGIVPVISRLDGIEDFIIEEGVSGMLCEIGNPVAFAASLLSIATDGSRQKDMSAKARERAEERFSLERMGEDYDRLFSAVLDERVSYEPLPWSRFEINRNYRSTLRRFVPQWLKNFVRRHVRI